MIASASRCAPLRRQQGNTLIGIIIGLVIGLTIAVIVALAITKGATPFTDKGKAGKSIEPTAGQIADPNKPMYGSKEAAREAAKDFAKDKEPKEAVEPALPKVPKEPKAPAPDALQQAIDELKPDEEPKPEAKAPAVEKKVAKVDAGEEKWVYYLQVGAFRETSDAESARAKLALLGFEAAISERSTDTGVLHRVRMGPFNQAEAMNRARNKLSENGVDVAVVRNQK